MKEPFYIQIAVNKADYKILLKYGFMLEKNINLYLHDIAEQLRKAENGKNKTASKTDA